MTSRPERALVAAAARGAYAPASYDARIVAGVETLDAPSCAKASGRIEELRS